MKFDEKFIENIKKHSSTTLCEIIVCDRYFNLDKRISVLCMQELSDRRLSGEDFDFENCIESFYKELPELGFQLPDSRQVINQLVMSRIKK